ncbi:galactokinase [Neoasaia chiangmaiensis]|uniref:Galactokinase n=2 Tax=Neoasaia chiangmaiensis TaxID=320497 RepID=A0A1U9KUW7_9PROT|nr:galactokinase [Neoasaia chiangmaiensis]
MPPTLVVQAPGRVNLIGEHTDYNDGFVLPCAIDFRTVVALRPRQDDAVEVIAFEQDKETDSFSITGEIARTGTHGWQDYVRGAFEILRQRGYPLRGVQLAITGNVPQGAGLSSSASLLVAIITACKISADFEGLDPKQVAVAARAVETDYVGIKCGIMDQMISACGEDGHALLIDCRSLDIQPVALHSDLAVLIVHSGVKRGLVESEYNKRREECERAASFLGVKALRDADMTMLTAVQGELDDVAWRRARHIITENRRVLDAVSVLGSGDTPTVRALLRASHASMRDDFEITTPKIDELVDIVQDAIGDAGGARMTGGGFGGCIVAVLRRDALPRALKAIRMRYKTPDGTPALCFACTPSAGAGSVR